MKANEKIVGKTMVHRAMGKVKVTSAVENSRVLVNVEQIDRGPGYDKEKQKFTGVRIKTGWFRGENRDFGKTDVVNISELEAK